ncbi:ATP-dependent dethiobiotin synthetase BioD, partial [Campylobacter jejuni]|nr:ATP-dependent dethiobiotin synthetase BioD [Campylobacter jejuni]
KNYAKIPIINLNFFDKNNILNKNFQEQMQEILQLKIP